MAADAMQSPPAADTSTFRLLHRFLPFFLALGVIGAFSMRQIAEADLGWHLALGKVISEKGIPYTNALCWTAVDHPWFSNSWLFDWLGFVLAEHFGTGAVQGLMFCLLAITFAGVHGAAIRLDSRFGGWMAPLLALLLIPRFTERPFVATWAALAWVLYLCLPEAGTDPDRFPRTFRRRLWSVPIIALAANLHQGALFAAIILVFFCVESFLRSGRRLRELALAGAGVVALFLNPGGMFGLLDSLGHVNVQSQVTLNEYFPPGFRVGALFFLLIAIAVPIAFLAWRRSVALLGVLVMFAGLGAWALRFMYDFELLAVPVLALGLGMLAKRAGPQVSALLVAAMLAGLVAVRWEWRVSLLLMGPTWNRWSVPVDAGEFIRAEHLDGRMYSGYWESGYLEWAMTDRLWFQDGRPHAFPLEFFRTAYAVDGSPEAFRQWMRKLDVEWAITGQGQFLDGKHLLHGSPDWALVYWDDIAEVFIRRDIARFSSVIERLEFKHFNDFDNVSQKLATAPRAELPAWSAEVDRVAEIVPDASLVAVARCGIAARSGTAEPTCSKAREILGGTTPQLDAARALSPAP